MLKKGGDRQDIKSGSHSDRRESIVVNSATVASHVHGIAVVEMLGYISAAHICAL